MFAKQFATLSIFIAALSAGAAYATPDIQQWQTKNGSRVYFVAAPQLPMVDVQVVFDAGSARDGDKPGVALMTNAMVAEGAGELDSTQIAEQFESVGAVFGNDAKRDMSVFTLRSLSDKPLLDKAIKTFALVLSSPSFPSDAFERERSRLLVSLEQKKESPGDIAEDAFYSAVFGDHPYAHPIEGSVETVKKLAAADLRDFYVRYMVARNAVVAIVGALDRVQAEELAEKLTGGLKPGRPVDALPEVPMLSATKQVRIDFPSSQSHIMVGQTGMTRKDPDYFALYLGNHILGGSGLVSILSDEIREKRGLAYSSYSYFLPMRMSGPFIVGLQTRNEQSKTALDVVQSVLNDFVHKGPTEEQLTAAKKNLTGGFALQVASNKSIVGYLAVIGFYQLPLDYLDRFIGNVESVTRDQIQQAYTRRIQPDKMAVVVVGGAAQDDAARATQ